MYVLLPLSAISLAIMIKKCRASELKMPVSSV